MFLQERLLQLELIALFPLISDEHNYMPAMFFGIRCHRIELFYLFRRVYVAMYRSICTYLNVTDDPGPGPYGIRRWGLLDDEIGVRELSKLTWDWEWVLVVASSFPGTLLLNILVAIDTVGFGVTCICYTGTKP